MNLNTHCVNRGGMLEHTEDLTDDLKILASLLDGHLDPHNYIVLTRWIAKLNRKVELAETAHFKPSSARSPANILRFMHLSEQLVNAYNLRSVVLQACALVLPSVLYQEGKSMIDNSEIKTLNRYDAMMCTKLACASM